MRYWLAGILVVMVTAASRAEWTEPSLFPAATSADEVEKVLGKPYAIVNLHQDGPFTYFPCRYLYYRTDLFGSGRLVLVDFDKNARATDVNARYFIGRVRPAWLERALGEFGKEIDIKLLDINFSLAKSNKGRLPLAAKLAMLFFWQS